MVKHIAWTCFFWWAAVTYATDFSTVVAASKKSVVQILEGDAVVGTGFYYRPDVVVTNVHVVSQLTKPQIQNYGGMRFSSFSVMAFDHSRDIVLLRVSHKGQPLNPHTKLPAAGSEVLALGHPRGLEMTATSGTVSAVRVNDGSGLDLIQTDAAVNPGNSGGPLIDKYGRVVGVVVSRLSGSEGLGFAVPIQAIDNLLKADRSTLTVQQFTEALYADSAYVNRLLAGTPKRLKDQGKGGVWNITALDPARIRMSREYAGQDESIGLRWTIEAKREKNLIYVGQASQTFMCFPKNSLDDKRCNVEFPVALQVKGGAIQLMAEYGKLNCETCLLENTSKATMHLVAASATDFPQPTGSVAALRKAAEIRQQQDQRRQSANAEAVQRGMDRACAAALASMKQHCVSAAGALSSVYCGEARANAESFCR